MNLGLRFIGFFIFFITLLLLFVLVIQFIRYAFKKTTFPKKLAITTVTGFALLIGIFLYIQYFFTFALIDKTLMQPGMGPVLSPEKTYQASVYYEPYGGVLGGVNAWVEVTNMLTDTTNIIYYADAKSYTTIQWEDETVLAISNMDPAYPNDHRNITLQVENEIYHENGLACQSLLLKRYETCFQHE